MPKIPEDKIDEIRSAVNIVHYISQFINLKKTGVNYKGLCPFHTEKTPSFTVSPEKQIFHCFGCGKGGNLFTFMMDYEKISFLDAVVKAADFAGISLPRYEQDDEKTDFFQRLYLINETASRFFQDNLYKTAYKQWLKYFSDRQISEKTIKTFNLGYAPDSYDKLVKLLKSKQIDLKEAARLGLIAEKEQSGEYIDKFRHRVIFPFQNVTGKYVGFGGRKLKEGQQPKYLNSPDSPVYKKGELLYGLHQAILSIREKGFVILVEGYFDLLRLYESKFRNVVASSGTALTPEQAKLIRRYTNEVYICYDGDIAGQKAAIRNAYIIEKQELNTSIINMPEGEDPDTFIIKQGSKAFEKLLQDRSIPVQFEIDHFLRTNPNPNFEQTEHFTQELLDNLSDLTNQVKIGLYLHQISERMQINESLLISQLNRIIKSKKRYKNQGEQTTDSSTISKKTFIKTGMYAAETAIVGLLMEMDPEIRHYINENVTYDIFENKPLLELYEYITHELEETGTIKIEKLMQVYADDELMKNILTEIAINQENHSMKYARDCIYQLKIWQLQKKSREISELIREESGSHDSVIHFSQELVEVRRQINNLEKERRNPSGE
jgi:DNA primase